CYLMCCRTDIDCAVAYYGTYIEHRIREAKNLHRLGAGRGERAPGAAAVTQSPGDDPQISRCRPRLRTLRRQDLLEAGGGPGAGADARVSQAASRRLMLI